MSDDLSSLIAEVKARYTIEDAWRDEGLPGKPRACCKSPFRDDRDASFSVYNESRNFKDFATGEGGDVIDFVAKARNYTVAEAIKVIRVRIGVTGTRIRKPRPWPNPMTPKPAPVMPKSVRLAPMPKNIRHDWDAGVQSLLNDPTACAKIDAWREWTPGTARMLAEHGIMGTPRVWGERVTAFAVVDAFGHEAGFHARHEPKTTERARWSFTPGTPALPFVLGGGHAANAREVFCFEGQWDAICFASAAGWFDHETAWPDHAVVFGVRGTDGWRKLLDGWGAILPKTARFTLFPDEDAAGTRWSQPGGFRDTLQAHGFTVRTVKTGHKDFTDAHRARAVSRGEIEQLLAREKP